MRIMNSAIGAACMLVVANTAAMAGVSADEASALKNGKLTPFGGETAGNADGSIPAWTGGMVDPNYKPDNGRRDNLFKGDKPLFSITAANMNQYADKLSEGNKAMFAKFPDTYRMDVYKTVRSAAAPQWVYDNIYKNALNGRLEKGGAGWMPRGVYGGIPFPIPKRGEEVIWNHHLTWRGVSWNFQGENILVTADGNRVITSVGVQNDQQMPYYFPDGNVEKFEAGDGVYTQIMLINDGPPIRAGEGIIAALNVDSTKDKTWVYLTGQRRTRMLPNGCCDTPTPASAGVNTFDDLYVFYGRIDRFDWHLVGKKEIYIPYNANQLMAPSSEELMNGHHLNPDYVRWELHRVWVVDTTLAPGMRNVAPKSRYYFDEDSWWAVIGDRYDSKDQLWKYDWQTLFAAPDIPAAATQTFGFYDLLSGRWYGSGIFNNMKEQFPLRDIKPASYFTPENMAAAGIR